MDRSTRLQRLFASAPINAFLGLELVRADAEGSEVRLPVRADFAQEGAVVHGGIQTSLADTAAVYALLFSLPPGRSVTGVELKLNFLRPVTTDGEALVARARPVHLGRRLGVVRVALLQAEREVAEGLFTYLVIEEASPS